VKIARSSYSPTVWKDSNTLSLSFEILQCNKKGIITEVCIYTECST